MMYKNYSLSCLIVVFFIGLSSVVQASKPSIQSAYQAKTVGDLLNVIRSAPGNTRGDFFVYNAKKKRFSSPSSVGIKVTTTAAVGQLTMDQNQINVLKTMLQKESTFKRLKKSDKAVVEQWVDAYAPYLLYFMHKNTKDGKMYKLYINDPNPKMSVGRIRKGSSFQYIPTAVYNIINKWTK
ncbi:MAG: hypothetical protein US69_C0014G0002 [candidate division TM6 bacterium GW2011_GWF2_38_10]|nr:MAG: hypothetical protein US69_C0014G0002 [candidate division TM6 bacterium GW2011_GWF2_38_10]